VPDIYAELAVNITKQCSAWPGVTWVPGTVPPSPKVVTLMKPTHTEHHVCGDLTLSGSGDLTGGGADTVIVIENGRLILDGNASIQTSRVAFVLTGDNTKPSEIEFPNGNGHAASLTLSPSTGVNNPWRGVSVYQDPALNLPGRRRLGAGRDAQCRGPRLPAESRPQDPRQPEQRQPDLHQARPQQLHELRQRQPQPDRSGLRKSRRQAVEGTGRPHHRVSRRSGRGLTRSPRRHAAGSPD
jgi:hypothetical protein